MCFLHRDGTEVALGYCTNVHPAQDLDGIVAQLDRYAVPIRERLGWAELGLGLWLPGSAASALADDASSLAKFRKELTTRGLSVFTLNGFPYGDFHSERVKKLVYRPDWSDPKRLEYTVDLANILSVLLPGDAVEGSISTLPLGWRASWTAGDQTKAAAHLGELSRELSELHQRSGKRIRVALEPEPGCVLERCEDLAVAVPQGLGDSIGVCMDTCHLAVGFQSPETFLMAAEKASLPIVKVQVASALHVEQPVEPSMREALRILDEPRYLHQVRCRGEGRVLGVDDLPEAFDSLPADRPWRVHFHAPVHATHVGALETTRDVLYDALAALFAGPKALTSHLEVETYTWDVLPGSDDAASQGTGSPDAGLVDGISGELAWTAGRLTALGLEGKQ